MSGVVSKRLIIGALTTLVLSSCFDSDNHKNVDNPDAKYFADKCLSSSAAIVHGQKVGASDADRVLSVMLLARDANMNVYSCSATLISDKVLLTAAHCVQNYKEMIAVFHNDIYCDSGYSYKENAIPVSTSVYHEDYSSNSSLTDKTGYNPDVALVLLEKSAPINYPRLKLALNLQTNSSDLYLYGYGKTSAKNNDSLDLRKATVQKSDYTIINNSIIIDQNNKAGVCNGDSGGGALIYGSSQYSVAAVNSFVFATDEDEYKKDSDLCNHDSSLVLVAPFLNWISQKAALWGQTVKTIK